MTPRPEILFLAHRIPYPPNKGDKIRSWRLLQFLSRRYRVHLAAFVDDPADMKHQAFLSMMCETATLIPISRFRKVMRCARGIAGSGAFSIEVFRDPRMQRVVDMLRAQPLAAEVVFSANMAHYIEQAVPGRPRFVDFCDANSQKFIDYAQSGVLPMRALFKREGARLAQAENAIANWADASFAISDDEAALFNERAGLMRPVGVWQNGVDTDYFDPAKLERDPERFDVVFTGAMDYRANIDAVTHFVDEIWPLLRAAKPKATFAIVGARPARAVERLAKVPGVFVTGGVEDIRPYIAGAKAVAAPMRVARGMQNKVLEAMAMGRPVVATSAAATGIRCAHGKDIVIADAPEQFAAALLAMMDNAPWRMQIGGGARERVLRDYRWGDQLSRFGETMDAIASSRSVSAA